MILITSPGQFTVEVLETYKTPTGETDCKTMAKSITENFRETYKTENDRETSAFVCLKQKEKEA
jgi:hypothetical protein